MTPIESPIGPPPIESPIVSPIVSPTRHTRGPVRVSDAGIDPVIAERDAAQADPYELDYLGRCVREFVLAQPRTARSWLIGAFSRYVVTCDELRRPVLDRPVGFDVRERETSSDVVFVGALTPRGRELALRAVTCNHPTTFDRITISSARERWTSWRLEVRRRTDGCDVAELPYSADLAERLLRLTEGDAVVLFEGTTGMLELDATLRAELRGVICAVDAITER